VTRAPLCALAGCALVVLAASADARTIEFASRTWTVHRGHGGPGPNFFSDDPQSVRVDDEGRLHMRIREVDGRWLCSEVYTQESPGYGTYRFQIASDAELYDPSVVVGLFVYRDDFHEIDIELTRQGNPGAPSALFTVQPYFIPGNLRKFELGSRPASTHAFEWRPDSIHFHSLDGHHVNPPSPEVVIEDWHYTGPSIPAPGTERLYINFYLFQGVPPADRADAELIVTDVTFTPAALVAAPWTRFAVARGTLAAGDLASVLAPDDARLEIDSQPHADGTRHASATIFDATAAATELTRLDLTIEASADGGTATAILQLYDFDADRYASVGTLPLSGTDLRRKLEIGAPQAYVRAADGRVRARVVSRSSDAPHRLRIDALRIDGAE
jgi:hypothetical protein